MNPSPTILIVDDEEDLREIVSQSLETLGAKIVTAASGKEGLRQIALQKVHAAVVDFRMPVMDGITFLKTLQTRGIILPCVMLTGNAAVDPTLKATAFEHGVLSFMEKPFKVESLCDIVGKALTAGLRIANIDAELDALATQNAVAPESRGEFRRAKRPELIKSILAEAAQPEFKKAG